MRKPCSLLVGKLWKENNGNIWQHDLSQKNIQGGRDLMFGNLWQSRVLVARFAPDPLTSVSA